MSNALDTDTEKEEYVPEYVHFSRLLRLTAPELLHRLVINPPLLQFAGYTHLRKTEKENFVNSPILIHLILMAIRLGSGHDTAEEIRTASNQTDVERQVLKRTAKALIHVLMDDGIYVFSPVNKIYVRNMNTINRNFRILLEGVFYIPIEPIDFAETDMAVDRMNTWVNFETVSTIKNMITAEMLTPSCNVVVMSSVYYRISWNVDIDRATTSTKKFTVDANVVVDVEFMNTLSHFNYYECEELKAKFLQLDLIEEQGSLVIVLPNEREGLERLEDNFETVVSVPEHKFTRQEIRAEVPKFVIATKLDWKPVLQQLGVQKLFRQGDAEISEIAGEPGDLCINHIMQKIIIQVDEEGIESTTVYFDQKNQPVEKAKSKTAKQFTADYPFLFYVKIRGIVVFVGRLINPSHPEEVM